MNVSLTIMEDADGEFSVAYCGRDCTAAMGALANAIATGKFVKGGVVRSPEAIKTRAYSPPSPPPAALPPLEVQPPQEAASDPPPGVPASLAEFGHRKRR